MEAIYVNGDYIELKYDTLSGLIKSLNAEIRVLNSKGRKIAIDGTTTDDTSVFGSRQMIMHHVSQSLKAYLKNLDNQFDVGVYYIDIYKGYDDHKDFLNILIDFFNICIQVYDENVQELKKLVDDYKTHFSEWAPRDRYDAEKQIYDQIATMYDTLTNAKEFVDKMYGEANIMAVAKIVMKYLERGTDFYDEPELFKREENVDQYAEMIKERHGLLKVWAHSESITDINI